MPSRCHSVVRHWATPMLVLTITLIAGRGAFAQTLADIASYSGADRTQKLIAGAKKEGAVSVYSSMTVGDMKVVAAGFQKKYGVKVVTWRASSENILQRAMIEHRAGRNTVDAIETGSVEMESLYREKMLQRVASPLLDEIVPQARRPHGGWVGDRLNIIVAGYNTNAIKKSELPKSYQDLLDPRWRGRLGIERDDAPWFGALARKMGEEKTTRLFRDIVAKNGFSVRKGHTLLANLVVTGEVPLALTLYQYKARQLKRSGAPIDWFTISPVLARFEGTGILRQAPHPYAAVLFLDFMLHDAQQLLLKRNFTPTNMKVKPLDLEVTVMDPTEVLDNGAKWTKIYDSIFLANGKGG